MRADDPGAMHIKFLDVCLGWMRSRDLVPTYHTEGSLICTTLLTLETYSCT